MKVLSRIQALIEEWFHYCGMQIKIQNIILTAGMYHMVVSAINWDDMRLAMTDTVE